jgi:anaerobic magnesium-protoporphyrin IX monomethyl ester cyclase
MRFIFAVKDIEEENLGILYLASMLKKNGHVVELVEATYEKIASCLCPCVPTILAFSTLAFYCEYYLALSARIKKNFNVFILFGGQHPTGMPAIIERDGVDAICLGEGEYPIVELADRMSKGLDYADIRNIWIKQDGRIIRNVLRPLIEELDELPFPDRTLMKRKAPFFYERINLITSRGCAYDCPYCYNSTMRHLYAERPNLYRRRSVENVLAEIRAIRQRQKVKFILFHDDIFTLLPEWVSEFSERYGREFHIPFSCNIRIDCINEKIIALLKRAGCFSVSFGLESGDDYVRKDLLKKKIEKEKIIEVSCLIKSYGIKLRTTNVIGAVPSTLAADIETLKLNIRCKVDMAKVGILSAYPNTAIANGFALDRLRWSEYIAIDLPWPIRLLGLFSQNITGRYERKKTMINRGLYVQQKKAGSRRFINFHKMFTLVVGFPFLFPFLRFIIWLPLGSLIDYCNFFWDNYCAYFRIYKTGLISFVNGFVTYAKMKKNLKKQATRVCPEA